MDYEKDREIYNEYWDLRDKLNKRIEQLIFLHSENLKCKAGCSECCLNLSLLPVEFYAIKQRIEHSASFNINKPCGFLKQNGTCSIYLERPIICRSHGLPISYLDDEEDEPEKKVSFCPRNFTSVDIENFDFSEENVLDIDSLNQKLTAINSKFLKQNPKLKETFRIHMENLLK